MDADAAPDISDIKGLAGLSDEQLVAQAARDFGQEAYFVLEDEEVSVVGAFSERTETILRRG